MLASDNGEAIWRRDEIGTTIGFTWACRSGDQPEGSNKPNCLGQRLSHELGLVGIHAAMGRGWISDEGFRH